MTSADGNGPVDGPEASGVSRKKRRRKRGRKRWGGHNSVASERQENRVGISGSTAPHAQDAQPPNGAGSAKDGQHNAPSSQKEPDKSAHSRVRTGGARPASAKSSGRDAHPSTPSTRSTLKPRETDGIVDGRQSPQRGPAQAESLRRAPKEPNRNTESRNPSRKGRPGEKHGAGYQRNSGRKLYAALDLGTNNCRLLVARPEERGFRVVDAYSRIVRLGEGVSASGRLSEKAMERAIEALKICGRKLQDKGVTRARLIATEACRAAENGPLFIERVREESGLSLEIVTRETEARLAVAGCVSLVDPKADGVVLFDIGGGSSELVWLDLRNSRGARGYALTRFIRAWTSLPVGVVTLAEKHGGTDVSFERFEAMIDDVSSHLDNFARGERLAELIAEGGVHMLGTSGTVTTLAGIHLGLKRYDRRQVDGIWLEGEQVANMINQLRDMSYGERVENPCIGVDRADLVLAGCAILEAIRRRWPCPRLRVADRGLREGILTELMSSDGVWRRRRPPDKRRRHPSKGTG